MSNEEKQKRIELKRRLSVLRSSLGLELALLRNLLRIIDDRLRPECFGQSDCDDSYSELKEEFRERFRRVSEIEIEALKLASNAYGQREELLLIQGNIIRIR